MSIAEKLEIYFEKYFVKSISSKTILLKVDFTNFFVINGERVNLLDFYTACVQQFTV